MSCSMNVTKKRFFKGKILKLQYYPEKNPYIFFKASGDEAGKQITMTVHRAVCLAFNGLPNNEKNEVGHLDGTKTNNVPENLIWCSSIENNHHKKGHGTLINGINCHNAILSDDDVRSILKLYDAGFKKSQLAKLFGVSRASIRNVINRKTWHHVSIIEKAKGK